MPRRAGKTVKVPQLTDTQVLVDNEEEEYVEESEEDSGDGPPEEEPVAAANLVADTLTAPCSVTAQSEGLVLEVVNLTELRKWAKGEPAGLPVTALRWDLHCRWGQIRPLNPELVAYYEDGLKAGLPRQPIKVLVRNMGSDMPMQFTTNRSKFSLLVTDNLFVVVGGQHISQKHL